MLRRLLRVRRSGDPTPRIDLDGLGTRPRIVVVVRDHMSGVLYSVPSLRALRRRWPDAEITLLANSYATPVLSADCPYVDRILPIFSFADEPERFARSKDLWGKFRTWLKLVGRVDLVVHLRQVGDSTLLFCATLGLPDQVGYKQGRFNRLLTVDVGPQDTTLGSRERNQLILERLGVAPAGEHLELWIDESDRTAAREWLADNGHDPGSHLTILHPGCHWGCNQWLVDRWSETGNSLLRRLGGSVVVTGSANEVPLAQRIVRDIDGPALVASGETTLGQFAAMIELAGLVVAVDTAPTQICQALDVPAVVMMGDGTPAWNGPVGDEPMVMLQEWDPESSRVEICDWASGACNGPNCRSRLEDITVTQVLGSVEQLLESRPDRAGATPGS